MDFDIDRIQNEDNLIQDIMLGDGSHPVHPQVVHTAHPGQVQANVTVQNQNVAVDNHTNRENELVIQEGNGDTGFEGLEFGNLNEAWKYYNAHAHSAGFSARKRWARKYDLANRKSEIVHYVQFVCNKEGEKKEPTPGHDNHKGKRVAVRTDCEAAFRLKLNKKKTAYILTYWNKEHNHELHPPEFVHMIRSNRSVNEVQGLVAKMNADCGIKLRSSYEVMALASGGKESLGFLHMDLKNHLGRKRQKDMAHGEATSMYEYFREKARLDPGFFYEVEVDSEESVANIFWADGRMRTDYACFGDAITFDTTFRTNKQYRPLALFVGFNHHHQICVLGAALLYDESKASFEWLLFKNRYKLLIETTHLTLSHPTAEICRADRMGLMGFCSQQKVGLLLLSPAVGIHPPLRRRRGSFHSPNPFYLR